MSRILRPTNPISHTPVKAYPLDEPEEAPYQPMHPNLQSTKPTEECAETTEEYNTKCAEQRAASAV